MGPGAGRRPTVRPRGVAPRLTEVEEPPEPETVKYFRVPGFTDQLRDGRVLAWIHDASVKPGTWYQYRIRLRLRNPLLMHEDDLVKTNRDDGLKVSVDTPWSSWSRETRVLPTARFFVIREGRRSSSGMFGGPSEPRARVVVFTKKLGQRVKHTFEVARGQAIGGVQDKTVENPIWQQGAAVEAEGEDGQFITGPVDFNTSSLVVDIDTSKTVVHGGMLRRTLAVVYLDDVGQLTTCTKIERNTKQWREYQRLLRETPDLEESVVAGALR